MNKKHRAKIKVLDCQILAHHKFEAEQYSLTLKAKIIAENAKPGQFVHLSVANTQLMRRPMSIMSVDIKNGTIDLLYKVIGEGTQQLSERKIGEVLSVMGPIGNGFKMTDKKRPLLIGGGVGMPPIIFICQQIKDNNFYHPLAILGSEVPFPFTLIPSKIGANYQQAKLTMPLLENWKIPCRLASTQGLQGVFKGLITELACAYLDTLSAAELSQVELYACGPEPMLKAVARLADNYHLPCQVSLEAPMACAVGGCGGCVVSVKTEQGLSMQRVCVEGPIFAAENVF